MTQWPGEDAVRLVDTFVLITACAADKFAATKRLHTHVSFRMPAVRKAGAAGASGSRIAGNRGKPAHKLPKVSYTADNMRLFTAACLLAVSAPAFAQTSPGPFLGRWNFNIETPGGTRASWLGVVEKNGNVEVWFQPTGGNVYQVKEFKIEDKRLSMTVSPASGNRPALTWELEAAGKDKLSGTQRRGETATALTGMRAPDLKRAEPKKWSPPQSLFNGKNLDGWTPVGDPANSRWVVKDGMLVNEEKGGNLKTTRAFDDFRLHFEVNCPPRTNSGMYLRGRYEVQLERAAADREPTDRTMGAIYGRIAPSAKVAPAPDGWESFDITLVGRTVTIVRNGVTVVDRQEIEGITGGALDASEGEPGPFYIQGDHAGGIQFRNIQVSVPAR